MFGSVVGGFFGVGVVGIIFGGGIRRELMNVVDYGKRAGIV